MRGRLAALNLPGVGSQGIRKLEMRQGRFSEAAVVWQEQVAQAWGKRYSAFEREKAWSLACAQIETMAKLDAVILCQEDKAYPKAFFELADPPLLIAVRGEASLLQRKGIAIVGTREPSEGAKERAYAMGRECAGAGRVAISGLALGCDTFAHRGALSEKGKTVAVLPSCLSRISPRTNAALAGEILDSGGVLVTEMFPKMKLEPYHFVQRNRLIAALSEWIVVVEAGVESGTMHTVKMGRKLNRKIGVVLADEDCIGEGGQWILDQGWGHSFKEIKAIL